MACDDQQVVLVEGKPFDIPPACAVLSAWDGRLNTDSKGAVLWREFLNAFSGDDRSNAGDLYSVPFDPADPVGTPNTIAENTATIGNNLAAAMMALQSQGWALDIALGDVQYDGRAIDDRISIPGGTNLEGAISIVDCCSGSNTLAPKGDPGDDVEGRYFTSHGLPGDLRQQLRDDAGVHRRRPARRGHPHLRPARRPGRPELHRADQGLFRQAPAAPSCSPPTT